MWANRVKSSKASSLTAVVGRQHRWLTNRITWRMETA
jgi:hypothetical protein